MTDERDPKDGEIRVNDRRRFDAEGQDRQGGGSEPSDGGQPGAAEPAPKKAAEEPAAKGQMPPLTFGTFLLSLATSGQIHLGAIPNPVTGKTEPLPEAAREVIDLLGMLQEKTRGNLTPEEDRLLEHLLYDLRMLYVELTSHPQS